MARILLTHSPDALENYYGARALAGLRALADVRLHNGAASLAGDALIDAACDCDLIVSYRQSPGPAALFARLPRLVAGWKLFRKPRPSSTVTCPKAL